MLLDLIRLWQGSSNRASFWSLNLAIDTSGFPHKIYQVKQLSLSTIGFRYIFYMELLGVRITANRLSDFSRRPAFFGNDLVQFGCA